MDIEEQLNGISEPNRYDFIELDIYDSKGSKLALVSYKYKIGLSLNVKHSKINSQETFLCTIRAKLKSGKYTRWSYEEETFE